MKNLEYFEKFKPKSLMYDLIYYKTDPNEYCDMALPDYLHKDLVSKAEKCKCEGDGCEGCFGLGFLDKFFKMPDSD